MAITMFFAGFYGLLTIWIYGFIYSFRKQLSCMVGMMAAMVVGMIVGLAMGSLLAIWLPGQFFQSTLVGMLVGGVVGAIAGAPISLMAVMDGLLSGIMGGMMGTMMMVMIPAPYTDTMTHLMAVLCAGIFFLLLLILQGEVRGEILKHKKFFLSEPATMFVVIALALVVMFRLPVTQNEASAHQMTPNNELEHSSQPQQMMQPQGTPLNTITVLASEFSFTPSTYQIKQGQQIQLVLDNMGTIEHDFEIVGTDIHIHASPGKKSSTTVSLAKAGYYQVICTLPGHKEAGMTASIQVVKS